ncbi:hypothetical protein [Oceaniglobus ichthyenteri]|uniref:hypothetical protein n=1 Tax=Oceaniglobus ichthyenteri TaxID=2136177 RepID=UPI000D37DD59|nr:hypothetical protein [Oceaniglobus ichthyenteri]
MLTRQISVVCLLLLLIAALAWLLRRDGAFLAFTCLGLIAVLIGTAVQVSLDKTGQADALTLWNISILAVLIFAVGMVFWGRSGWIVADVLSVLSAPFLALGVMVARNLFYPWITKGART